MPPITLLRNTCFAAVTTAGNRWLRFGGERIGRHVVRVAQTICKQKVAEENGSPTASGSVQSGVLVKFPKPTFTHQGIRPNRLDFMHKIVISGLHEIASLVMKITFDRSLGITASIAEGSAVIRFKCFALSPRRGIIYHHTPGSETLPGF